MKVNHDEHLVIYKLVEREKQNKAKFPKENNRHYGKYQ